LEALSKVISRQKEIAETIGNEVDLQNGKILLTVMLILTVLSALASGSLGNDDKGFTTPGSRMMGTVAVSGDMHIDMSSKLHSGPGNPHVNKILSSQK
jgi:hypothetical protein